MTDSVIAAIDVGTNSVHMVVAQVSEVGFTVLTTEKINVRLGEGSGGMDHLTPEAIERGVNALVHMKRVSAAHNALIRAVATSAVREAENSGEFLSQVKARTGLSLEVISGVEEATLIHMGVRQSLNFGSEAVLSIDIGGGSTEFALSIRGRLGIVQSLKMGAVRLTDAFIPGGVTTDHAVKSARAHIGSVFAPLAYELRRAKFSRVVLSSGTSETIAKMISMQRGGPLLRTLNGFLFSRAELLAITQKVLQANTPHERGLLPGMDPKRCDIIAAGSIILSEIAQALNIETFEFSDYALREGVLLDTAHKMGLLSGATRDGAMESVLRLAIRCSVDLDHSQHVASLSKKLFTAISRRFDVDPSLTRLLEAAAILANTGNAVSYSKHHHHSYYIIRHADLTGFTNEEIEMIALTARYHRKSSPKTSHSEYSQLPEDLQHNVDLMAGILRIATGLDRSHDQSVSDFAISLKDDLLTIRVRHCSDSDESIALNIYTAQQRTDMLKDYLGVGITLVNAGRVSDR